MLADFGSLHLAPLPFCLFRLPCIQHRTVSRRRRKRDCGPDPPRLPAPQQPQLESDLKLTLGSTHPSSGRRQGQLWVTDNFWVEPCYRAIERGRENGETEGGITERARLVARS